MALAAAVKCKCGQLVSVSKPNVKVRCPKCKTILNTDSAKTPEPEKPAKKQSGLANAVTIQDTSNATGPEPKLDAYETIVSPMHNPPTRPGSTGGPLLPVSGRSMPESLGPYKIIDEIGRGGMGRVLKGHDGALQRDVAIKILKPDARADTESRLRFIKEAQISGQLEHPGIPPVHFLGWDEHGSEFFSMKLISGQSLSIVLDAWHKGDEKTLRLYPLPRLLSIYERVCEAIGFAHSRGVIHRDLKPANVMIGEHGEVWVLDWGLAKVYREEAANFESAKFEPPKELKADGDAALTMAGTIVGTPGYLAPEQALGDPLDDGCDIFGLGALLYEILTAQPPHMGKDLQDTVNRAALGKILPVRRTPKGKNAPAALIAIVEKCMALRRKDRYAKVTQLLNDLRAYAAGEAISVKRDSPLEILARFVRRHKTAAAIFVLAVVVLIVVIGIFEVRVNQNQLIAQQNRQIAQEAELDKRTAELKQQTAELERQQESELRLRAELDRQSTINAASERATRRLNAFKPYAQAIDLMLRGQLAGRSVELLREALKIDPDFPEAQFALGEALRGAGTHLDAAEAFLKANELNRRILDEPNLQALLAAGMAYDSAGYYRQALDCFLRAEKESPDDPLALVGKSYRLYASLEWSEGRKFAEQALARAPHLWEAHLAVGFGILQQMEIGVLPWSETRDKCYERLRTALEISPRQAETCTWLGQLLLQGEEKDRREAMQYYARAIALEPKNGGRYLNRATVLTGLGQLQQAEADYKQAEKFRAAPAQLDITRARLLRAQGRMDDARALMDHVYKQNSELAIHLEIYAMFKAETGQLQALPELIEKLKKQLNEGPGLHWITAISKRAQNDAAGAVAALETGLKLAPYSPRLLFARAESYMSAGNLPEAVADLDKILAGNPNNLVANEVRLKLLCDLKRFDDVRKTLDRLEKSFPSLAPKLKKWRDIVAENDPGK